MANDAIRGVRDLLAGCAMTDVTHIFSQIESGDPLAAEKLLPLIYDELRGWRRPNWPTKSRGRPYRRQLSFTRLTCGWWARRNRARTRIGTIS